MKRAARGVGLIDGLIALAILAFGMLAMTRFQARMLAQGSEAQSRLVAMQLADELLGLAMVDPRNGPTAASPSNGPCYAVPTAGGCTNAGAAAMATAWAATAAAALPGGTAAANWNAATNQLSVTLRWTGKAVQDGAAAEQHQVIVTTDVR